MPVLGGYNVDSDKRCEAINLSNNKRCKRPSTNNTHLCTQHQDERVLTHVSKKKQEKYKNIYNLQKKLRSKALITFF